jgi:hypothetical protein
VRRFGSKITKANWKEGDGVGVGLVTKQVVREVMTQHGCPVTLLPIGLGYFRANLLPYNTSTTLKFSHYTSTCI